MLSPKIIAFNEEKTLAEWSRDKRCIVKHRTLSDRIINLKWNPEKAMIFPLMKER